MVNLTQKTILALALAAGLGLSARSLAQAAAHRYTGTIGDDMCGVKHDMKGSGQSDADCVRMCEKAGSAYALIVGDKAYTLAGETPAQLKLLGQLAAKRVTVVGTLQGTTLTVHSLAAAR